MPIYNNMEYIKDSIDSILNQTVEDFELIIINDGSTQPIQEVLSKYSDSRIHIFEHGKNIGTPKTLNEAIKISKGDIIARQDSDDISLPTRFEEELKLFKENVEVVSCYGKAISFKGKIISNNYIDKAIRKDPVESKKAMINNGGTFILGPAAMFSKKVVEKIGYYDEAVGCGAEDTNYWNRALQFFDLDVVPKDLFRYRINPKSMRLVQKDQFGNGPRGKVARRKWVFERSKTHTIIK